MLFPEYHNRFRYTAHVSLRKWVFINQLFLLSISKFFLKKNIFFKKNVHYRCSCAVNSLNYYTCTTVSLTVIPKDLQKHLYMSVGVTKD
jgi:hypothetical protein